MKIITKTRDEILDEALELIAKEGLPQVTIRSLANHTEVSVGTLYNYFVDKDSLLTEIMNHYWKDAIATLTSEVRVYGSISELTDALFIQLKSYSGQFHRDFIHSRDPKQYSQEFMKRSMETVFKILEDRVMEVLDQLPFEEHRFGKKSDFANLLIDQVVNCLQRKESDLGSLKIIIRNLEVNQ